MFCIHSQLTTHNSQLKSMLKFFNNLSLRHKLFLAFFVLIMVIIFVAAMSLWFYNKRESLSHVSEKMEETLVGILKIVKVEQDFFATEPSRSSFYSHGRSKYLDKHQQQLDSMQKSIKTLTNSIKSNEIDVREDLLLISKELDLYRYNFRQVVVLTRNRGFKDYGKEGDMREIAHFLENSGKVSMVALLTLRKHEKDYISRKENIYIDNFEAVIASMQQQNTDAVINKKLLAYKAAFKDLVALDKAIGYDGTHDGFKYTMRQHGEVAINIIEKTIAKVNKLSDGVKADFQNIFVITMLIVVVVSLTFSYFLSFFITIPIIKLSEIIELTVDNNFEGEFKPVKVYSNDEVGTLSQDFNLMITKIQKQLSQIKSNALLLEEKNGQLEENNQQVKQSEKRLEKLLDLKNKLFSIISQDLRNPLNSLKGFLNILKYHTTSFTAEELQELSGDMYSSLDKVMLLMEDVIKWSRSQSGDLEYNPNSLHLKKVIEENLIAMAGQAQEKYLMIETKIDGTLYATFDKDMLDFILKNLLSNAYKFSHENGKVIVSAEKKNDNITIRIKDFGVGMSNDVLSRIFDPNTRVSMLGTNKEKGSGLGLLMCKDFVEKNGGLMMLKTEEGKGTTVSFTVIKASY